MWWCEVRCGVCVCGGGGGVATTVRGITLRKKTRLFSRLIGRDKQHSRHCVCVGACAYVRQRCSMVRRQCRGWLSSVHIDFHIMQAVMGEQIKRRKSLWKTLKTVRCVCSGTMRVVASSLAWAPVLDTKIK
jgi:hypothetical protein